MVIHVRNVTATTYLFMLYYSTYGLKREVLEHLSYNAFGILIHFTSSIQSFVIIMTAT